MKSFSGDVVKKYMIRTETSIEKTVILRPKVLSVMDDSLLEE